MARVARSPRRPRNSIKDRPRRLSLLFRRIRGKMGWATLVVLAAVVLVGGSTFVGTRAASDGLAPLRQRFGDAAALAGFRIEHVLVLGRHHTPESKLLQALGVHRGDPTLGFSVAAARARIERLPWVKAAAIERRLPATIVVQVIEKRPFALWQHDTKFSVIDRTGAVVDAREVRDFRNLPLVVGPGAPAHTAALLDQLARLPAIAHRVTAAVRVGERRWNLLLKDGTTVELPEGHSTVALDRLAELEAKHALLDRPLAVVDMRLPDRLVVRPWPTRTESAAHKEPG